MLPEGNNLYSSHHFTFKVSYDICILLLNTALMMMMSEPSLAVCGYQDSRSLLLDALCLSKNEGFCLGVKLVRGAYMDKERKLAMKEGRLDPIHPSWEDTNDRWLSRSIIHSF